MTRGLKHSLLASDIATLAHHVDPFPCALLPPGAAELPMVNSSGGVAMWTLAAARSRHGGSLFLAPDARSGGLRVRGHLSMAPAGWSGRTEAEDYEALLLRDYPALPREFAAQVRRTA